MNEIFGFEEELVFGHPLRLISVPQKLLYLFHKTATNIVRCAVHREGQSHLFGNVISVQEECDVFITPTLQTNTTVDLESSTNS